MIGYIFAGIGIAAAGYWLYKNLWPYIKPRKRGPGSNIHIGPYGQIEGEPNDDPYEPPEGQK